MFALNQRLPCVRGAGAERLRGWRDVFRVVRCSALRTTNPSVIFLRKCHLPLHKGGLKGECAAVLFCSRRLCYAGGYGIRPYGAEQNIICRGDHILAKQVCHEAKRNNESPVTLSALPFGFAQTKEIFNLFWAWQGNTVTPHISITIFLKVWPRWAKFLKASKLAEAGERSTLSPSLADLLANSTAPSKL